MRKIILLFTLVLALAATSNAQTKFSVTGLVKDNLKEPIFGATILILNASDSVLYKFGVSKSDGKFGIRKIEAGDYILQVTFLGFKNYGKKISVTGDLDVGTINMEASSQDLKELTVEADAVPLDVRNDTIAYNAAAFQTQPGAVVEDLLKRLPGVEVESDGSIKAQGEDVQKVVVDGKEFFGNDPQTATKNIPADAIDKIEVYDEQSDMADFTGVDDGQRTKTINLTLKKDRKKGYFGNIEGGYGTENRYKARGNINRFNQTTQTSFIGTANNTNEQGFSIRDYADFMGGFQNIMRGGRGRFNSNDLGLPISNGASDGFINTGAGGLNLNHEFKKETNLNLSYFYTNITKDLERTIDRENIFAGTLVNNFYEQADTQLSNYQNHNIRSTFRHKINDNNSLIWRGSAAYNSSTYDNQSSNANISSEQILTNGAMSDYNSTSNSLNFNTSATLRHKFAKKGRSIAMTGNLTNNNSDQTADLISSLNYYDPDSFVYVNQRQLNTNDNLNYRIQGTYTEPLGKRRYLSFSYNHRNFNRPVDKTFTDQITGTVLDSLSAQYTNGYLYHQAGLSFRMIKGKSNLSLGVDGQYSELQGTSENSNFLINQNFQFLLPSLQWRYEIGQSHNIRVQYRTSANEPDIDELQPILDNSDPLNLYIGNPNLQPEYTHRMNINYLRFDQFTFSSFFANVTATYTQNDIAQINAQDRNSVRLSQPINVDYRMTLRGYLSYSTPIKPIKSRIRVNTNFTMQKGLTPVANIINVSDYLENGIPSDLITQLGQTTYNTSGRIRLENREKDVIDISGGFRLAYNQTVYDNSRQPSQSFISQNYFTDLLVNFNDHWSVSTKFNYTIYEGNNIGTTQAIPLWQASLRHYFMKNRRAELRLTAMDILNRNVGINWSSNANYTQQEVINSLGRYFMLSFRYQIRSVGK